MALVSECIPDFDFGKHMFLNICFVLLVHSREKKKKKRKFFFFSCE